MPTYQYTCTTCDHDLEAVQSFSDDPLTECPECSGRLRKVFSAVGVVFKGSGFYRTDSRAGDKPNGSKGSSNGSGGSESAASAGTKETKAANDSASSTSTESPKANTPAA
ncbi:MAG TPA: FmdB family zinc ribbon protein [Micromonosporaceae bacterium]